jgi:predicted CXXCH cytochrome family protein
MPGMCAARITSGTAGRAVSALALLLLLAAPPAAAQGQTISLSLYFPPDQVVVEKADLPVEGVVTTAGVQEVEIAVNTDRPRRATVRDTLFAEEVSLEEGQNTIRVGPVYRMVWFATARTPAPAGWQRAYGHFGLYDSCRECHKVGEGGKLTLAGEPEEICSWCHGDLVRGRPGAPWASVHLPVKEGKCLLCHAPHTSTTRGLPAESPPACTECHQAVAERLKTDRFVHGPMNLGDCRICHAVHSSREPGLLVRPATALCVDCHADAVPPPGTPAELQPHGMIREGQCYKCHEPHSSANQRLLREPAGRLCQRCHEGKTRSFHEAKGFSIYVCSKCHDLHRPNQPHLIMDASRSLCLDCHEYRATGEVRRHSFVSEGKCFLCHTFHEAPLAGDVAGICLRCHRDNPRLPEAHSGIPYERSRCTVCHEPHQSRGAKLLLPVQHTPFAKRECDSCHRDRAAKVGPVYRALCLDCHPRLDLGALPAPPAVVHPPFKEQDCASCHRSHNSEVRGLLRYPGTKLCLDCHRKMRKATLIAPVSAHTAVTEGRCADCHEPHFSENEVLLRRPVASLCAGCHAAVTSGPEGRPWRFPHKPVAEGKCRVCHREHTSANPRLLKTPMPQPCRPCHAAFFTALETGRIRSLHPPVKEAKCDTCHRTHGGDEEHLLAAAGEKLCRGCHKEVKTAHHRIPAADLEAKEGGKGAGAKGCVHCHLPHVSSEEHLLPPLGSPVCQGCHKT